MPLNLKCQHFSCTTAITLHIASCCTVPLIMSTINFVNSLPYAAFPLSSTSRSTNGKIPVCNQVQEQNLFLSMRAQPSRFTSRSLWGLLLAFSTTPPTPMMHYSTGLPLMIRKRGKGGEKKPKDEALSGFVCLQTAETRETVL